MRGDARAGSPGKFALGLAVAGLALVGTVGVSLAGLAFVAPSLRAAFDTGAALIGVLATVLLVRAWIGGARFERAAVVAVAASVAVSVLAPAAPAALCCVVAAAGLAVRGDTFSRRIALAVLFLGCADVGYALLPPVAGSVQPADVLRLASCVVLLWAAVRELGDAVAARAAAAERRRIARDLHDGVAQELAFIRRRAARLAAADIVGAADRALLDSRLAVEHLASPPGEPLDVVLARHVAVIAARTEVMVTFSTTGSADVGPEVSEALARILGEAVANSRHGGATRVHVELSCSPLRMRVVDDGAGFDPAAGGAGFGLGGMRERAELVGAKLSVRSGPGAGTEVAVELG
jgi:signal transduction histidine kinase